MVAAYKIKILSNEPHSCLSFAVCHSRFACQRSPLVEKAHPAARCTVCSACHVRLSRLTAKASAHARRTRVRGASPPKPPKRRTTSAFLPFPFPKRKRRLRRTRAELAFVGQAPRNPPNGGLPPPSPLSVPPRENAAKKQQKVPRNKSQDFKSAV